MWDLVKSGGWAMVPIVVVSVVALAITLERLWSLRRQRLVPPDLLMQVWNWIRTQQLDKDKLRQIRQGSPLGEIFAAGLVNSQHGREIMKEAIEEAASRVVHEMERYMTLLGTIAVISPLLGLLGTVFGIITTFYCIVF